MHIDARIPRRLVIGKHGFPILGLGFSFDMMDTYNKVARIGEVAGDQESHGTCKLSGILFTCQRLFSAVRRFVIALFFLSAATAKTDNSRISQSESVDG